MTQVRPLADADRPAVGEILAQAFADKMPYVLGPRDLHQGPALMADLTPLSPNHFVAEAEGRVAGVLLLKDRDVPNPGVPLWRTLRRRLSVLAAVRAAVVLSIYNIADFPSDRLYVDTLAVHPDFQGRGVAGALLRFAQAEARRRGKPTLALYVIDRNAHARAVYEHLGFRIVRVQGMSFLASLMGFKSAFYMEMPVSGPA